MKDLNNITIAEYMQLELIISTFKDDENTLYKKVIELIHGDNTVSKKIGDKTIQKVIEMINEKPDFIQRFIHNGVEYGFIPNLDEITTGEFIDLDDYMKEGKQLHRIASILYRPVIKSAGKTYQIEPYEGTQKYSTIMNDVNYKVILGALVFFCNLRNSLLNASDIFIKKQQKKIQNKKDS